MGDFTDRAKFRALRTLDVWLECGGQCTYCGRGVCTKQTRVDLMFTTDHDIPFCRGGKDIPSNWVGSCWLCNTAKCNLTRAEFMSVPDETREHLRRQLADVVRQIGGHQQWQRRGPKWCRRAIVRLWQAVDNPVAREIQLLLAM